MHYIVARYVGYRSKAPLNTSHLPPWTGLYRGTKGRRKRRPGLSRESLAGRREGPAAVDARHAPSGGRRLTGWTGSERSGPMSLPYRQQRRLRHIGRVLRGSDPHLTAMLSIFARLTAGERMPAREQLGPRRRGIWSVLRRLLRPGGPAGGQGHRRDVRGPAPGDSRGLADNPAGPGPDQQEAGEAGCRPRRSSHVPVPPAILPGEVMAATRPPPGGGTRRDARRAARAQAALRVTSAPEP